MAKPIGNRVDHDYNGRSHCCSSQYIVLYDALAPLLARCLGPPSSGLYPTECLLKLGEKGVFKGPLRALLVLRCTSLKVCQPSCFKHVELRQRETE